MELFLTRVVFREIELVTSEHEVEAAESYNQGWQDNPNQGWRDNSKAKLLGYEANGLSSLQKKLSSKELSMDSSLILIDPCSIYFPCLIFFKILFLFFSM